MVARAVEHARRELTELRREEWEEGALAGLALTLSVAAAGAGSSLALPLFLGGAFVAARAVRACWRHWDLLDRLTLERDAYAISEVRARAEQAGTIERRRVLASAIRRRLELPVFEGLAAAGELAALAAELEDEELALEPVCAVACDKLLTDGATSPLLNETLPAEDVRSRVRQIRAGFSPRADRAA